MGATRRLAKLRPSHTADRRTMSATSANMEAKAIWMPAFFASSAW